ncbi:MAG: methyltransferase family protein [Candidatus Thorarchaeota archaeon]
MVLFIDTGPYQYTRNLQYLVLILFYISVILITSSYFALLSGTLLILMYAITPLSEEPWLVDQFGEVYRECCIRIPRFFGSLRIDTHLHLLNRENS